MAHGVLLLGFGGPTPGCCGRLPDSCPATPGCEAACFVSGILADAPARSARVAEVAAHYQALGGYSPYNELTGIQARALAATLNQRGRKMPVVCGFRHWRPWIEDGVSELHARGCNDLLALVMAPHQCSVSWDWYLRRAREAVASHGAGVRLAAVAKPWWDDARYIQAIADRVRTATQDWDKERFAAAELVFTAHAVPEPVARSSPYCQQFAATAALAARALGHAEHRIAYQSGPATSPLAWTAPTIHEAIDDAHRRGRRDLVVAAAGFLVDHVEVLYDIDIDAAKHARERSMTLVRAPCVHDHASFMELLADRVLEAADTACAGPAGVVIDDLLVKG